MTKIWKETGFVVDDPWVIETDDLTASGNQKVLLALDAAIEVMEAGNDSGLGVLIRPADDVRRLGPYLDRVDIVALEFPAFNDGRAFSHASLLRERLGYRNELRAVGDVLLDQIPLMLRVGIDSLAVTNSTALQRLSEGRLPGISIYYQPAAQPSADGPAYSWRRRSVS